MTIVSVQMKAIPVAAARVLNALGHPSGYRNFDCPDASTNTVPSGILVGGDELHKNHHAIPSSAKFAIRSWEFDIGWVQLRSFQALAVAQVLRVAPSPAIIPSRNHIDLETVRAVIVSRMHVLRAYTTNVIVPVFKQE